MVLQTLKEHQLNAKFSKCEFWLESISFLGHMVSSEGIQVNPKQIEIVTDLLRPTTVTKERFQKPKDCLTITPVLTLLVSGEGCTVCCDASKVKLEFVLMQHGKVVAYASRKPSSRLAHITIERRPLIQELHELNFGYNYFRCTFRTFQSMARSAR
ncbi:uncharacterized protein LOC131178349 [Hevea brasiliensis]|uniref:uncharacterized protein LOC131178349 n=1 Tax=Hevea brasiliensis TaxID=3981 RepID=UPI0025F06C37|nr:uncharacterized protein LOC131178349 [Hevea brasiliensis]